MSFENPKNQGVETRSCPKCGTEAKPRSTNCQKCGTLLPLVNIPKETEIGGVEDTEIGKLDKELAEQNKLLGDTPKRRFLKRKKIENKIKEINENIIRAREEIRSHKEQEGKNTQTVDSIAKSNKNTPEVSKAGVVKRIEILKPLVPDPKEGAGQNDFRDKFKSVKALEAEEGLVCPRCHEKFPAGSRRFCPADGNRLIEEKTGEAPKKESSIWLSPIDAQKEGEQEINLLENINIESNISYQGENYTVKEIPNEENKNKYVLEHSRGKPIYKLTAEQLSKALESGEAKLVLPVEENKEDIARLRELDELKVEEAELREAIENLRKQILALPDEEPAEKAPKQIEKEIKTFSTEYIKSKILPLLENFVSEVKNLEIKGVGEEIILNTTVVKYNFNIGVEATLQNEENGIGVKSYKINASFMAKGKAEREIAPQLNKVSDLLREYIEKEENRKVEKIEIENGELKVTFENK